MGHWGCARNEERSNFSTSRATCSGEITFYRRETLGIDTSVWLCDKHRTEEEQEQDD